MTGGALFRAHCAMPTAEQMQTEQMEQVAVPARVQCLGKSACSQGVFAVLCSDDPHYLVGEHKVEAGESVGLHQMQ